MQARFIRSSFVGKIINLLTSFYHLGARETEKFMGVGVEQRSSSVTSSVHLRKLKILLVLMSVIKPLLLITVGDNNVLKYVREQSTLSCSLSNFVQYFAVLLQQTAFLLNGLLHV